MKINYILLLMIMFLQGCAHNKIEFKQEPLTGQEYCLGTIKLFPVKNNEGGTLILKHSKDDMGEDNSIKATLKLIQEDKEYNINASETFKLYIDGTPFELQPTNSFQEPTEQVSQHHIPMPSGRLLTFGTIKDITIRNLSFFLSLGYLEKMVTAKQIVFEIASASSKDPSFLQKYPIILEFRKDGISFLQEFKSSCFSKKFSQD